MIPYPSLAMRTACFCLVITIAATAIASFAKAETRAPTIVLATTEGLSTRTRSKDGAVLEDDPGHVVELSRKAAEACGTTVEFRFMPWPRVLKAVRVGQVSAGFASSFKEDRAVYGAYPMKDGKPNEALAQRAYAYHLYARADDLEAAEDWTSVVAGAAIGVERGASIIPVIEGLGADPYERTDYGNMLELMSKRRYRFVAGISDIMDTYLEQDPELGRLLVRLDPPLEKRVGYVMFSKIFYDQNAQLVECFWEKSAAIAKTPWYQDRKAYYEAKFD